jgi:hypothetical protein
MAIQKIVKKKTAISNPNTYVGTYGDIFLNYDIPDLRFADGSTPGGISLSFGSGVVTYSAIAGVATVSQGLTGSPNLNVGIVTGTLFYGNGSNLAGVITSLVGYATQGYVNNAISGFVTSGGTINYSNYANVSGISTVSQGLTGTPDISVGRVGISSYLTVTGVSTFLNNVHIEGSRSLIIGDNDELQLFHSGVDSYIDNDSAGNLIIRDGGTGIQLRRSGGGPTAGLMAAFNNDAGVELYYNSILKLQTFQNGVAINDSVAIGTAAGNPPYRLTVSGIGATITQGLVNAIADLTSSVDGYGQVNIRNSRSSPNASGDLVITADIGTDVSNYIDLGINNTGFSTSSWTINGPLDAYLYTSSGNLSIGAGSTNKYLSLFAGGTLASNEQVRVTTTGVGIGTTNATSRLTVSGNSLITGISTIGLGNTSTPPSNSQMSFELVSNTQLRIKVRGTDGILRSADITLT